MKKQIQRRLELELKNIKCDISGNFKIPKLPHKHTKSKFWKITKNYVCRPKMKRKKIRKQTTVIIKKY